MWVHIEGRGETGLLKQSCYQFKPQTLPIHRSPEPSPSVVEPVWIEAVCLAVLINNHHLLLLHATAQGTLTLQLILRPNPHRNVSGDRPTSNKCSRLTSKRSLRKRNVVCKRQLGESPWRCGCWGAVPGRRRVGTRRSGGRRSPSHAAAAPPPPAKEHCRQTSQIVAQAIVGRKCSGRLRKKV